MVAETVFDQTACCAQALNDGAGKNEAALTTRGVIGVTPWESAASARGRGRGRFIHAAMVLFPLLPLARLVKLPALCRPLPFPRVR